MKKPRSYAEGRIDGLTEAMRLVPHNWTDPLLTGPEAIARPMAEAGVEELLNAVQARIYAAVVAPAKKRKAKRGAKRGAKR